MALYIITAVNLRRIVVTNWPLIVILIISLAIRLFRIDTLTTFGADLGQDIEKIWQILHGHFTLLGPQISRFNGSTLYLGPLYYYLEVPFLLLTKFDPIGIATSMILVKLAMTFFVYKISQKIANDRLAIFAALISALSPYWISSLGPPSPAYFVPLISAFVLYLLLKLQEIKSKRGARYIYLAIGALIGATINFHYLGLVLAVPTIIYLVAYRRQLFTSISLTTLGFIISILPLALFELRHQFFLTSQVLRQLSLATHNTGLFIGPFTSNLAESIKVLEGDLLGFTISPVTFAVVLILVAWLLFKKLGRNQKFFLYLSLILISANLIFAGLYFGKIQPHYLAVSYPALFILTALLILSTEAIHKYLPYFLILLISMTLLSKNNLLLDHGYTMPEDLTLSKIRQISKIIASDTNQDKFNITSTLDGDSRALPYRYLVQVYGKNPASVEVYDKLDSLYVITRDPKRAVRESNLFEIASFQPSNVAADWEVSGDIHLIKLTKKETAAKSPEKFITIVSPVRSRDLWASPEISSLKNQINEVLNLHLAATWLLTYDNFFDNEVVSLFKQQDTTQEIGAFLEISQKWATDAKVSYKVADGDYYRPDKIFLSGYSQDERKKLIKTYFKIFKQKFGYVPRSIGAWYIDSYSQNLLASLGVTGALTVSDQFDTDAETIWGKYFAYPYYPSKYNSIEPAGNQSAKIPIVNLQWAQRDPITSYGKDVKASRESFQANDYLNNGHDHAYFKNLLATYLSSKDTDFVQITIGLETGQEASRFAGEFASQLEDLASLAKNGQVKVEKMSDFSNWYQIKYPGISPAHFLEKDGSLWYMSPKFRAAIFKENQNLFLKDLRYYGNLPQSDYFHKDTGKHLEKVVPPVVDNLVNGNQKDLGPANSVKLEEKFDRLNLTTPSGVFEINTNGVLSNGKYQVLAPQTKIPRAKINLITAINFLLEKPKEIADPFKYSKIDDKFVFGFAPQGTKLIGLRGLVPGIYAFDFQTLAKFKSPAQVIEKLQSWIR